MIRPLLIIQVPDASDKWGVALTFRPSNRFPLRLEGGKDVGRMVFDDVIIDWAPLRAAFRAWLDVNVCQCTSPPS